MFCGKCGAPNPDNSQFCSSCGSPLAGGGKGGQQKAGAAVPKKPDIKIIAALAAVAVVVVVLLVFLLGRGGKEFAADQEIRWAEFAGRWYRTMAFGGEEREVFWFQPGGVITVWQESGEFTEMKNGPDFFVLAHGGIINKNTLDLIYSDDMIEQVKSYFGTDEVKVRLSQDKSELTFYNDDGTVMTLKKYPGIE